MRGHSEVESRDTFQTPQVWVWMNPRKASRAGYRNRGWNSAGAFKSSFVKSLPRVSVPKL